LADIHREQIPMFIAVLKRAGLPISPSVASLDVLELGEIAPDALVADLDNLAVDPLERLRQLRFVLPACIIVVYTGNKTRFWGLDCHLAGANGVLSKASTEVELAFGVRSALRNGCFTDPRLTARVTGATTVTRLNSRDRADAGDGDVSPVGDDDAAVLAVRTEPRKRDGL
jgi:DNA-binding NarL/FixJ family response regulator